MSKKITLKTLEMLNPLLEEGKYFEAGKLAENTGCPNLAKKYYSRSNEIFIEKQIEKRKKKEVNEIKKRPYGLLKNIICYEEYAPKENSESFPHLQYHLVNKKELERKLN